MEQLLSANEISERKRTLLGILNQIGNMDDENQLIDILYIAQSCGYIEPLYNFRIENVYLPYSQDLHHDIVELIDKGYIKKSSLIIMREAKKIAEKNLGNYRIDLIKRLKRIEPEELHNIAQLAYLHIQKNIPKKELLRKSPTVATRGLTKTKDLLKKLDSLKL